MMKSIQLISQSYQIHLYFPNILGLLSQENCTTKHSSEFNHPIQCKLHLIKHPIQFKPHLTKSRMLLIVDNASSNCSSTCCRLFSSSSRRRVSSVSRESRISFFSRISPQYLRHTTGDFWLTLFLMMVVAMLT